MEETKNILIDPPTGWRYGFPKSAPAEIMKYNNEELKVWLAANGYPERLIDETVLNHCRFIF